MVSGVSEDFDRLLGLIGAEPVTADDHGVAGHLDRICRAAVRWLPADGAGVTLMGGDGRPAGTIAASSLLFRRVEDLQFTLGEGPCFEAHASHGPVLEDCLTGSGLRRWPAYAAAALEYGVNAVFAFPIQVGAARLGVLDVYRYRDGPLAPAALADAFAVARICLDVLLSSQATGSGDDIVGSPGDAFRLSAEVYQAQGVVMVTLGVSLAEAMVRLRAHAYAVNRPIGEVARDVVAGTLDFGREGL